MRKILPMLLALLMLAGCSQSLYQQGKKFTQEGNYDRAIDAFYQEIAKNPQSATAWRELGVAFYEKGDYVKSEDALKQANNIEPDPRTNLYLGLLYEKQGMADQAVEAYSYALGLSPRGDTKNMIRAHLDQLVETQIRREVDEALAAEAEIDVDAIPDNTVAVVGFDDTHLTPELAPLARGLAEFTAIDLAKVHSLRVVDRLKIDAILNELKLSSTKYADRSTAPRLGKLLGSRRMVTGSVLELGEDGIKLDGAIINTTDSSLSRTAPAEGQLQKIFEVQKNFVFSIIDDMGIELTAEERDAIMEVPTESYLAFLAYCRGLDYQHRGFAREAAAAFESAASSDAAFEEATVQLERASGQLSIAAGGDISVGGFETAVLSATDVTRVISGLDARLSNVALLGGIRIPTFLLNNPVISPPVVKGVGTIIIRGDLDAQ